VEGLYDRSLTIDLLGSETLALTFVVSREFYEPIHQLQI